jgi:hypothetical protein
MHNEAESRLLAEGALTYVGAVNAVRAFRDIIKRRCHRLVQDRLAEYAKALDWKLGPDSVLDWETAAGHWNGEEATIGSCIKFGKVRGLYHLVYLTAEPAQPPEVYTSVYLGTRKKFDRFWEGLSPHDPALTKWDGSKSIMLSEPVTPAEFGQFDKKLDAVLVRWIELWRRAGGLKRLWSQAADGEE